MRSTVNKRASSALSSRLMTVLGGCLFVALATAGLLALSSCGTLPNQGYNDPAAYVILSNSVATARTIVPYVPAPANSVLEGVLAVGGALLALWASHLHRSISNLQNGGPASPPTAGQGPGSPSS